jgi:transposase
LALLADKQIRKSKAEIVEALTGDWREEYLFELRQSHELYCYLHEKARACDQQIESILKTWVEENEKQSGVLRPEYAGKQKKRNKNDPRLDLQRLFYQLSGGIDLAAIEGVGANTLLTLLAETGLDLRAFPSPKHFCSWLRLAPNNKITGKKIISSKPFPEETVWPKPSGMPLMRLAT